MFVLGIQGSPRPKGNSSILLSYFLTALEHLGANIEVIEVAGKKINPCLNCGNCEREGFCGINDDMQTIYPLLGKADIIVVATPVFFYSVPAQLKALIDRCQVLWARKYIHKIFDPNHCWRKGYLLSVGATKGEKLFFGLSLTIKYFFEAIGANYAGSLTFRGIEKSGEINQHPEAIKNAQTCAISLAEPLMKRKKILFIGRENSCRSQMAEAFTQWFAGDKIEAESAGSNPAEKINSLVVEVMKERGIDMAFRQPKSTFRLKSYFKPDLIVAMGCRDACPFFPDVPYQDWNLPDPAHHSSKFMRTLRDEIEKKVQDLLLTILPEKKS